MALCIAHRSQMQEGVTYATPDLDEQPLTTRRIAPRWHVILLDDNDHSYDYVVLMLMRLFGHSPETAFQMAIEVDAVGLVIVDTTTKERAELKRDQIHDYGPDPLIRRCAGSMSARIEPAHD